MGRRVAHPKKGHTKAEYNAYMRDYMREYNRRRAVACKSREEPRNKVAADAIYDPLRDGPLSLQSSLIAILMGDPPIGRRAIDQRIKEKGFV